MELSGSKTEKNLVTAFLWESQERNRFSFFSNTAEKEGYHKISRVLATIAEHERIHAKNFFRELPGGQVQITAKFFSGKIGKTEENLKSALEGKNAKLFKMYSEFGQIARDEGFEDIARIFLNVIIAEKTHENMLKKALKCVESGMSWKRDDNATWICSKCGFVIEDKEPPSKCPACNHPKEYFEILFENL
jgi:rubrerythrin